MNIKIDLTVLIKVAILVAICYLFFEMLPIISKLLAVVLCLLFVFFLIQMMFNNKSLGSIKIIIFDWTDKLKKQFK
jgi:hypothetical protein